MTKSKITITPTILESEMRKCGVLRDAGDGEHVLIDTSATGFTKLLVQLVESGFWPDSIGKASKKLNRKSKQRHNPQ